jgi:putative transposase
MSRTGDCDDNAVMEAFFSTLKTELADRFESCGDAKMQLFDYIEVFYNQRRRHSTIGYVSPAAFERAAAVQRESVPRVQEAVLEGILQPAPTDDRRSWGTP